MKTMILGGLAVVVAAMGMVAGVQASDAPYCREYSRTVTIGGKKQESYGTACMQPDGSWKIAGSDEDVGAPDDRAGLQVEPVYVEPRPLVVYEEPVVSQYTYYAGPSWGLDLGWSGHDGHGRGGGWHGGPHGGWR
jgi:hypothetical protein